MWPALLHCGFLSKCYIMASVGRSVQPARESPGPEPVWQGACREEAVPEQDFKAVWEGTIW